MNESQKIIEQIDIQVRNLLNIRSLFPAIENEMVGQTRFSTAPFYQNKGLNIVFTLSSPLTLEKIQEINEIGRWVNQSFVIRLCALLESYHLISKNEKERIDQKIDGHEDVDILRRLRNVLAHTSGRYNPKDSEERKLYERIIEKYSINIKEQEIANEFPLHIDTFLLPLAEGCKRYVFGFASP